MKIQIKIIFGAIIIILILGGYILNDKFVRPYYQDQGISAVINEINIQGQIPILNNQTISWIPLQTLCTGVT